jgi:hypothetical protein
MSLTRLEEFKHHAEIQVDSSEWLCEVIDTLVSLEEYYSENPDLDTPDQMERRLAVLDGLQARADWENKQQQDLLEKYSDIIY